LSDNCWLLGFAAWTRSFRRDDLFTANGSDAEIKYKNDSKEFHNRASHDILENNTIYFLNKYSTYLNPS
jgi:hypothetical protein